MDDTIALDSIQAIAASFGSSFEAEKVTDTLVEKDGTRYYKVYFVLLKLTVDIPHTWVHVNPADREFLCNFENFISKLSENMKFSTLQKSASII